MGIKDKAKEDVEKVEEKLGMRAEKNEETSEQAAEDSSASPAAPTGSGSVNSATATKPAPPPPPPPTPTGDVGQSKHDVLYVNFFDDDSLSPIEFKTSPKLEIRPAGKKGGKPIPVTLETYKGRQYISLAGLTQSSEDKTLVAELAVLEAEAACTSYAGVCVEFQARTAAADSVDTAEENCCNCICVPMHALPATCIIKFRAWDASNVDFIENAKAFQQEASFTVTAVRTQPAASHKTKASAGAAGATPATTQNFVPYSSTVKTVNGTATLYGVPGNNLYQFEAIPPDGYVSNEPALHLRNVCCERFIEKEWHFRPCGVRPQRSLALVLANCQSCRWGGEGKGITIGENTPIPVGADGIVPIPETLEGGVFPISAPNVIFNPSSIDLGPSAPPVITVTVAEQPVSAAGKYVAVKIVDETNTPFARRPIWVLTPDGEETQVIADDNGNVTVPARSYVYAREDEWGAPTERMYVGS